MANPYKKAEEIKKKPPVKRHEEPEREEVKVQQPAEPKVAEQPIKEPVVNPLAGMIEQKPRGKSYGFYLDEDVVAALDKLAKQNKSNKSKVLNTLLRNLLLK